MKLIIESILFGVGLTSIATGIAYVAVKGLLYFFNIDSVTPVYYLLGIFSMIVAIEYYLYSK